MADLYKKIESLPPLPKTIIELEEFKKSENGDPKELIKIIQKDPLIITTLLKVANSAMFGLRTKVENVQMAVNLLGVDLTISIAFGAIIKEKIDANLSAYKVSVDDFLYFSSLGIVFVQKWLHNSHELLKKVLLPLFLQETGKFIISNEIRELKKEEEFFASLKKNRQSYISELEFVQTTSSKLTAELFRHWKLSPLLVDAIEQVNEIENSNENIGRIGVILYITKNICDINNPFDDERFKLMENFATKAGFNKKDLTFAYAFAKNEWQKPMEKR